MHFIFGGRGMGKLAFAKGLKEDATIYDLSSDAPEAMLEAEVICNVHCLVRDMLRDGGDPLVFFQRNLDALSDKIVIGDEVGGGVVPVEPFEREWRDETGRVYQLLAARAEDVTRVWAGLPQALKRGGKPCAP